MGSWKEERSGHKIEYEGIDEIDDVLTDRVQ